MESNIWAVDFEVFRYDWLVVFKNIDTDETRVFANDWQYFNEFVDGQGHMYLVGHNCKWYDRWIFKAIRNDFTNHAIYQLSKWIVSKRLPWEFPDFKKSRINDWELTWVDTMDDGYNNRSLKTIEGYLGLPIVESSIPWDLERPLTEAELEETINYCKNDVNATIALYNKRSTYFQAKKTVAKLYGIPLAKAMGLTNAKLAALVLGAEKVGDRGDEREYQIPTELESVPFPAKLMEFFNDLKDYSIPDKEIFDRTVEVDIGNGVTPTYGFGGIHYAKPGFSMISDEVLHENN